MVKCFINFVSTLNTGAICDAILYDYENKIVYETCAKERDNTLMGDILKMTF